MTTLARTRKERTQQELYLAAGKRRRKIREAITGYLFVFPAALATFLFGLWPVIAGFYESIKSGSPLTNKYVGFNNYVRSLGSLIYVLLFALCVILLYIGYRAWNRASIYSREYGGNPWHYIVPGLLVGAALIVLAFTYVTGVEGYNWIPVVLSLLAISGFYTADRLQVPRAERNLRDIGINWLITLSIAAAWTVGPRLINESSTGIFGWLVLIAILGRLIYQLLPSFGRISAGSYISASILMGTLMLFALLLGRYTIGQMENSTRTAQQIAALIFNQQVLDATVDVVDEDTRVSGLMLDEEIIVQVEIGSETIEAPLAPDAFSEIAVDKITQLQTALSNNQMVRVVLPDGSIAEGKLTGLPMGEKLPVEFTADEPRAVRQIDIYSALDVGEAVVRAEGHTEPLRKQFYAALGVFIGLGAVYLMTKVRHQVDNEDNPRIFRWLHLGRILLGIVIVFLFLYLVGAIQLNRQAATGINALSKDQFARAYQLVLGTAPHPTLRPEILAAQLLYWPQVFLITIGALLIGLAYLVWQSAQKRESKLGFGLTILLAVFMMVGGWLTISELPRTMGMAGREAKDTFDALVRTAMYSVGTVPVQLALGLFLAYLLFSEISWGKSLFRVIYFMPYIAPSVATSTVFLVIFSLNKNSLANQALGVFGIEPMRWLKETSGIVRLVYQHILGGDPLNIPAALQGPSLALFTVILYNIWVFAGYNAVVFLAGLGAIPPELYEAAEVDGAGRWSRFRNITLPLLSPTTFFLSMLSIIGTFKAFSHIYVLRRQAAGKEIDTMSVHIFNMLYSANDPGYAAALAFTLFGVILILTLVQNRLAREQVFYG